MIRQWYHSNIKLGTHSSRCAVEGPLPDDPRTKRRRPPVSSSRPISTPRSAVSKPVALARSSSHPAHTLCSAGLEAALPCADRLAGRFEFLSRPSVGREPPATPRLACRPSDDRVAPSADASVSRFLAVPRFPDILTVSAGAPGPVRKRVTLPPTPAPAASLQALLEILSDDG